VGGYIYVSEGICVCVFMYVRVCARASIGYNTLRTSERVPKLVELF
jgi:hypothetical protein